jgi:hypothetical protein
MNTIGTIRKFHTKRFSVIVDAVEDYGMDLSFDDTGDVRKKLESGEYVGFAVRARVLFDGTEIAADYLGGCVYESIDAFMDHRECGKQNREWAAQGESGRCGSYFSDMVHAAIAEARINVRALQSVRVRA